MKFVGDWRGAIRSGLMLGVLSGLLFALLDSYPWFQFAGQEPKVPESSRLLLAGLLVFAGLLAVLSREKTPKATSSDRLGFSIELKGRQLKPKMLARWAGRQPLFPSAMMYMLPMLTAMGVTRDMAENNLQGVLYTMVFNGILALTLFAIVLIQLYRNTVPMEPKHGAASGAASGANSGSSSPQA
jgi:hypothetical protein